MSKMITNNPYLLELYAKSERPAKAKGEYDEERITMRRIPLFEWIRRKVICYIITGRRHRYTCIGGTMADSIYECTICYKIDSFHTDGG